MLCKSENKIAPTRYAQHAFVRVINRSAYRGNEQEVTSLPTRPVTVYVLPAVPGAPSSLTVTNLNLDSLTLEWDPPHARNGHITGYTLKYQPGGTPFLY